MLRMSSFVCVIAALAGTVVLSQQPDQPVFRSTVRTVPIYATVVDPSGRLVPSLERTDFSVVDNGKPAEIALFSNESQPFSAVEIGRASCRERVEMTGGAVASK